jgi:hypothetical protein
MKRRDMTKLADLKLRVNEQLRHMIEVAAANNYRTMSAEMVARLSDSFSREKQEEWTSVMLNELVGPPELRLLSKQLVGSFAVAAKQYAEANKLPGSYTSWNNDAKCWEAATIATIISLATSAPGGPTQLAETLRSLIRKLQQASKK